MASMLATSYSPSRALFGAPTSKARGARSAFHFNPASSLGRRALSSSTLKGVCLPACVPLVRPCHSPAGRGALGTTCSVVISTESLRWVATAASVGLLLTKNTAVQKPLVVVLLALTVPQEVTSWIRGDYGLWVTFVGLVVRLFYSIPGELELPLAFLMLVITAPVQLLSYRSQPAAAILSLVVSSIVAYQHFSRAGGVNGAFQRNTIVASIAVIIVLLVPIIFFLQGVY